MRPDTKKWVENFNQELVHIQIEFDAFFAEGKIDNYYDLKVDDETGVLTLNISSLNELPKQIADSLSEAFIKSKP
jgi:hypothetical protein